VQNFSLSISSCLFATAYFTELLNGSLQDRHFFEAYDCALTKIVFVIINFFSKKYFFFRKWPQAEVKES